jgi:type IV pilus assembly protein PilX
MKHTSIASAHDQWSDSDKQEARLTPFGADAVRRSGRGQGLQLRRQSGIALLTALLILIMLTLLAVAMFRGFGLQQKIAGNVREKERAFQAAENALQYGEWWLSPGNPNPPPQDTGIDCTTSSANITVTTPADMRVCSTPLTNASDPTSWTGALVYTPPKMTVAAGGGVATDGNNNADINYTKSPLVYIAYLGLSPTNKEKLYSVTAAGFGGSSTSTAVVRSVVSVSLCGGGAALSIDGTSSC